MTSEQIKEAIKYNYPVLIEGSYIFCTYPTYITSFTEFSSIPNVMVLGSTDRYEIHRISLFIQNNGIPYKNLVSKCMELMAQIDELKRTIYYYKQSIETYKRLYNTEKQANKKC